MRKLYLSILLAAMVMAAGSCGIDWMNYPPADDDQTESPAPDPEPEPEVPEIDPADVSIMFNVKIPTPVSVNDADAGLADEMHYALYSIDEENISFVLNEESLPIVRDTVSVVDKAAAIELGISGGSQGEYVIIIWAQNARAEGEEFYDLTDLRHIRCVGESSICNSEERVAYYITHKFSVTSETYSEDLVLSRPHSRINLGTFAQALKRPDGATLRLDQSSVTIKGASASFNTIAGLETDGAEFFGKAGESAAEGYEFTLNAVPEKLIVINDIGYPYLALNYMFVSGSVDMDFVIMGTPQKPVVEGTEPAEDAEEIRQAKFEGRLSGINARQDFTTTIIGYFFGADGRFEYDFRITTGGGSDSNGNVIIGDEDGDGLLDDEMDYGWSLGGDDSWTGGGGDNGDDEYVDPDEGLGDGDDDDGDDSGNQDQKKEDVRIEYPDAVTWEVYTLEGLYMWADEVRSNTTSMRINLKLFADIYMEEPWTPLGYVRGSIDGQGYTIHDLTIEQTTSYAGFLSEMGDDAAVGNLNFANVKITGQYYVGAIAGSAKGVISNCKVLSGSVTGTGENVGGMVGFAGLYLKFYDCENYATVSGKSDVGGILGEGDFSTLTRCTNHGNVTSTVKRVGGICGYPSSSKLYDCTNYGTVEGVKYVGGIAGDKCTMVNAINHGEVKGVERVGGISARIGSDSSDCKNYGSVSGELYVGGCGGSSGAINFLNFENHASVTGNSCVGGIVGEFSAISNNGKTFSNCINDADVTGSDAVGGLIGEISPSNTTYVVNFTNNKTTGTISGATNVGYLAGLNGATINDDGTNVMSGDLVIIEDTAE